MKQLILLFLLFTSTLCFTQKIGVIEKQATEFALKEKKDTINFIVMDTNLTIKKPIFLFCQGSLPIPLCLKFKEYGVFLTAGGTSNFDLNEIKKHYHVVVVSMPKTPTIVDESNLNNDYCYVPDTTKPTEFSKAYLEANYLQNYVNRANKVLKYLKKQSWVDNSKLIVAGHSQGTKVATKITIENKDVTHLGLFAANPFGRVDQFIRQARLDTQKGKITWEEADKEIESIYDYFKTVHNKDSLKLNPDLVSTKSFSEPSIDDWLEIEIPIYLAYGTADIISDLCDIAPLFFIQKGKKNLTLKRYLNREHNFFEVDNTGKVNYENHHWHEVMNTFINWTLLE